MSKDISGVTNKEPLMHISKRDGIETWKSWLIRMIAVLLSLVVCAGVIVALTGLNPIEVYKGIFDGAIGTKRRVWMTIRDTLVLLCIAVGITPAFKMRYLSCYDDLSGTFPSFYGIISLNVPWQCSSSYDLGRDSGIFQGLLEYK